MVTDSQVRRLFKLSNQEKNQETAALKADMDPKTARRYLDAGKVPSEMKPERDWRTRQDPFAEIWQQIEEQLREAPGLEAKTVFAALQREHPGRFEDGQLRTLQRRFKIWRATEGPAQEAYFAQIHEPGRLGASDFTRMSELEITIGGQSYPHMVYHFVLTYSNWETGTVCFSESFESLSEGLQNALWELGGVPARHRTDSLSSAVNNMSNQEEFTRRYEALLKHYRLQGEHIQPRKANENGDVEQSHHRFKRNLNQALLLRGNRDFANETVYQSYLREYFEQANRGRRKRLAEEVKVLRELPMRRLEAMKREWVRVDSGSLIAVDRNVYSVHSRLIGEQVEARLYVDRVEVWYGQKKVEQMPRLRGRGKHRVDYRHIIDWLVRKPGAFESYRYREDLFPTSRFRMAYDGLQETSGSRAVKEYLRILELAAKEGEAKVDEALGQVEDVMLFVCREMLERILAGPQTPPAATRVRVAGVQLNCFDELLETGGVQ
jgi:hypothetical protein